MTVQHKAPELSGEDRRIQARARRIAAADLAFNRPHPIAQATGGRTLSNGEEDDYSDTYCTNFTKGLAHNQDNGVLTASDDYEALVEAINRHSDTFGVAPGGSWFEEHVPIADAGSFTCRRKVPDSDGNIAFKWRGWESPRTGHAFDLEGPDAEALCMAPAPKLASKELQVEMAEVYALALFRDIPFKSIADGTGVVGGQSVASIASDINAMPWFTGPAPTDPLELERREARGNSVQDLFRGSAQGVKDGPYVSQFLMTGSDGRSGVSGNVAPPNDPVAEFGPAQGLIVYGTQVIDQKVFVHKPELDYMTQWHAWLDVQNGANLKGMDQFLPRRRFISTPRDLATFVHFDELYQAYFNAALLLSSMGIETDSGFPSGKGHSGVIGDVVKRDSFATFGGPHLLAMLTEVSSRALRAVRRQKFNYHRRARPEVMGWIATLAANGESSSLGNADEDARNFCQALPASIRDAIAAHNEKQNQAEAQAHRSYVCDADDPAWLQNNLLLPMAFPEGSPMHPAYGAGHATVAGACVTVLKAFFKLRDGDVRIEYDRPVYESDTSATNPDANATEWGRALQELPAGHGLTLEGELNKLAANIAIGRNMAGVHYYTDYYDSMRLGERIATGILQEQMTNYSDSVSMTFWDFDDNKVQIVGGGESSAIVFLGDNQIPATDAWWFCSPLSPKSTTSSQTEAVFAKAKSGKPTQSA